MGLFLTVVPAEMVTVSGGRGTLGSGVSQQVHLYQCTGLIFILVDFVSDGFWMTHVSKGEHF